MTGDLRTRIANVAGDFLSDNFHAYLEQDVALELADVVIRELKADYILVPKSHTVARWIPEGIFS